MSNSLLLVGIILFSVLWGAVIGIDMLIIPAVILALGWIGYITYKSVQKEFQSERSETFKKLDGKHVIELKSQYLDKNLIAEVSYKSAGDGMIELDLLRIVDGEEDVRTALDGSTWSDVRQELKEYFADLRGHEIPYR